MRKQRRSKASERGFILIFVLFMGAVLALLWAQLSSGSRAFIRQVTTASESARAEALAESGINLAILKLSAGRANAALAQIPADASPVACTLDDGIVVTSIQDTGGRININLATEDLLLALFLGLGAETEAAKRYAEAILDFRDRDDDRRPFGAEAPEYRSAQRSGPKNGPFDAVEELDQVLGLEPQMIAAMMPHITIHSGTAGLDPNATRRKLAELLNLGRREALTGPRALPDTGQQALPTEFAIASDRRSFFIISEARLGSGAVFVREVVVEFPTNRATTYRFKTWKRGTVLEDVDVDPASLGPC